MRDMVVGEKRRYLKEAYGVSGTTINDIASGRRWLHITSALKAANDGGAMEEGK